MDMRRVIMLCPQPLPPIPDDTARVARAAFPKGHPYLGLADTLGDLITDGLFAPLFPARGQPALAPWRLALATILQFAEGLTDVQAADAVRSRIDWKYVLRLDLTDAGFDASVLCEFRARLVAGEAEDLLLDTLLAWCRAHGLLKARGKQRTDSTHVLAAGPRAESARARQRGHAPRLGQSGGRRPRLAAGAGGPGMGRPLRAARGGCPAAQE